MKNPLLIIVCVYLAILAGIFLGRNMDPAFLRLGSAAEPLAVTAATEPDEAAPININTASFDELQTLPGIGPALARRIIDYRKENGPYENLLDLMNVCRLGPRRLSKILNLITTGG